MTRQIQLLGAAALATVGLALAVLVLGMAGSAAAGPASTARAKGTRITLRSTSKGKILATARGFTVYAFSKDKKNKDACAKITGCTSAWPLITTKGKPLAGKGVKASMLGTIKVKGKQQVTYGGHPLYGYVGDSSPGQIEYVGFAQFGGTWPALTASGTLVH